MAQAEDVATDGAADNEILVTATKRAVSVQDVPLAVAAFDGDSLEKTNAIDLTRLGNIDPGLQIQSKGAGDNQIIIRGIQSAGASLVSVYMDEAVVTGSDFNGSGGRQSSLPFYDVERVEVLKGPQGTLFGSGSMAGSVRVVANKPDLDEYSFKMSGSAEGGSGTNGLYELYGVANLPIVKDKLGLRVTAWDVDGGGYLDREASSSPADAKNTNDQHVKGARAILRWDATDDLTLTFTGLTQKLVVDDVDYYMRSEGPYVIGTPTLGGWDETDHLASFVGEYKLDFGTITATSSYYKKELLYRSDTTYITKLFDLPGGYQINEGQNRSIWSNELRFASDFSGPFQVVAGLFYEKDKDLSQNVIGHAAADGNLPCELYEDCAALGLQSELLFSRALQHNVEQYAVFGQADYNITDQLTFTAGIRYYTGKLDWMEYSNQSLRLPDSPIQTAPITTLDDQSTEHNTSYNFSLGWRPTEEVSFYARAASGFRLGGINSLSSRQLDPTVPVGYDSDTLWNYEVGAKFALFDRKLTIDTAAYYIDWSGQQVSQVTSSGITSYIANAGTSDVKGFELSFSAKPVAGLSIGGGFTYTNSKLTEDQPLADTDPAAGHKGDHIPLVPKWSFSGQVGYEVPVGSDTVYAQTSFNYRGRAYTDFNENGLYIPMEAYFRADASIGLRHDRWDVSVFVKNITDKAAQIGVVPLTGVVPDGEASVTTIRPRTFGVKLTAGF
ncbi:MAG: TonB-dependent receptor [Candidatus Andeanibacterium colombiense]|uniref:TonB-dependent receptor n=1 Tax=Candidatus Andeanibacterium colombiense TaxID=3121345 RepID=A0AAJ5X500_9SPHN|nr:MAG: TonB-dependent receptor [Sphingomonadaceae bacterium]